MNTLKNGSGVARWGFVFAATILPTLVGGCGETRLGCEPVVGTVRVAGKTYERMLVAFHPLSSSNKLPATGQTAKDGTFELSSFMPKDGAPVGEYAVTVTWPVEFRMNGEQEEPVGDRLGGRFANKSRTPLRATIKKGEGRLPPIDLN